MDSMRRRNRNRGYMGLRVWQDAVDFYCETCKIFGGKPRELSRIMHQTIGSSDSVHRNIAEGYCRRSKKEYLNLLNIALGSLGESVSGLHAYRRAGQISPDEFERLDSIAYRLENRLLLMVSKMKESTWPNTFTVEETNAVYEMTE